MSKHPGPGNLTVQPAGVHQAANGLCADADKLRGYLSDLQMPGAYGTEACGNYDAPTAYLDLWTRWNDHLDRCESALEELCGRVHGAATAYVSTDTGVRNKYDGADPSVL